MVGLVNLVGSWWEGCLDPVDLTLAYTKVCKAYVSCRPETSRLNLFPPTNPKCVVRLTTQTTLVCAIAHCRSLLSAMHSIRHNSAHILPRLAESARWELLLF